MAHPSDDPLAAIQEERDRDAARALAEVRRAEGAQRNADTEAWLTAGDNLAEKAIAALDLGDEERAIRLVRRIVSLPVVDEDTRSGLMAVSVLRSTRSSIRPSTTATRVASWTCPSGCCRRSTGTRRRRCCTRWQ